MGVDCGIKTSIGFFVLDRWHVFSRTFIPKAKYQKKKALKKLRKLYSKPDNDEYSKHWLLSAIRVVNQSDAGENVQFFIDTEDDYYKERGI